MTARPHDTLTAKARTPGDRRRKKTSTEQHRRRMIAYGQHQPAYQDATGTLRRTQALMAAGWPLARQAAMIGRDDSNFWKIFHVQRVTSKTARAVAALYDEVWDQAPPLASKWEKSASTCARRQAAAAGWPPPLAWDDDPGPHCIDDPAARPAPGWKRQETAA